MTEHQKEMLNLLLVLVFFIVLFTVLVIIWDASKAEPIINGYGLCDGCNACKINKL